MSEQVVRVKKKLLPIEATIVYNGSQHKILIHKVAQRGCILEVFSPDLKPQQNFHLKFILESEGVQIEEDVLVVKTYNKFKEVVKNRKIHVLKDQMMYLAEVHYKKPKIQTQDAIEKFLKRFEKKDNKAS
jgi:Zn-dependent metalloprotease